MDMSPLGKVFLCQVALTVIDLHYDQALREHRPSPLNLSLQELLLRTLALQKSLHQLHFEANVHKYVNRLPKRKHPAFFYEARRLTLSHKTPHADPAL